VSNQTSESDDKNLVKHFETELSRVEPKTRRRIIEKFILAALGSIPWVGGFIAAAASFKTEETGIKENALQSEWLREHETKIRELQTTLGEIDGRFQSLGGAIDERLQSKEYLVLVRKAFRLWDSAETSEKRAYAANIVVNSAGTRVCSDDVVRLFLDWLSVYHESHFAVVREIFRNPSVTRYEVWTALYGEPPKENSAEADLFRLLIRDLSTGGVIRQQRETDLAGHFLRKPRRRTGVPAPTTMESAFEDSKPYVLTELGRQFVHYTMNEVVTRLDKEDEAPATPA
jgi:hypothetical protein